MSMNDLTEEQRNIVLELREKTGRGQLKCLECLEYHDWDFDKAKEMAQKPNRLIYRTID